MIAEATTLLNVALAMGVAARIGAREEAKAIRDRINAGIDEDLDHGELLRERLLIGGIATAALALAYAWLLHLDDRAAWAAVGIHTLRLIACGWAAFTITHRLALNGERGKAWWYCAPGNVYDRMYLWVARGNVKVAGVTMYVVEGLVATVTAWSLWW